MDLTETTVDSQVIYDGAVVRLRVDRATLPNGAVVRREVVEHPGGVAILALDEAGQMLLVRQFRYPFGRTLLEIPAGKLERGEDPLACARRELAEETGAQAGRLDSLGQMLPSPGAYGETLCLYLARDLTFSAPHPDADEFLQVERMPFDQAVAWALDNRLQDGKTVCALLKAKLLLG